MGYTDDKIILMLADDIACNPRNKVPGCIYNHYDRQTDLYGEQIQVDYNGDHVTIDTFLNVLRGHGGDGFLKFQDSHEMSSREFADGINYLFQQKRYKSILLIIDTCQAQSMVQDITAPNVISITSSRVGESSYSHHIDGYLGVPVIDRFTDHLHSFLLQSLSKGAGLEKIFLKDLVDSWNTVELLSTPTVTFTNGDTDAKGISLGQFFNVGRYPFKETTYGPFPHIQDINHKFARPINTSSFDSHFTNPYTIIVDASISSSHITIVFYLVIFVIFIYFLILLLIKKINKKHPQ